MDVLVVGSCNVDLVSYVPTLPKLGETVHGTAFAMGFGGKGANQCVMASILGASSAMLGKVGSDFFGNNTVKNFKEHGVNTDHILVTDKATTGVAPISVDSTGNNAIIVVQGANGLLTPENVSEQLISTSAVLICQLEIPVETTLEALQLGRKHGVITILNAAPATTVDLSSLYANTDVLCVNEVEAETLLPCPPLDSVAAAMQAVKMVYSNYSLTGSVVITLGGQGVVFAIGPHSTVSHVPATTVSTLDTTGAGDAFVGALGYYLACHKNLAFEEKIRRAGLIASLSVTRKGTQSSYFKKDELPKELF